MKPPSLGVPCRPGSKATTAVSEPATVKSAPTPATFNATAHLQRIAVAWLRETGEHRPAIEILESNATLSSEFRSALAEWMRGGCKPKKRMGKYRELPSLATSRRVELACLQWKMSEQKRALCELHGPEKARAALVKHVAESLKVHPRTAGKWVALYEADAAR